MSDTMLKWSKVFCLSSLCVAYALIALAAVKLGYTNVLFILAIGAMFFLAFQLGNLYRTAHVLLEVRDQEKKMVDIYLKILEQRKDNLGD